MFVAASLKAAASPRAADVGREEICVVQPPATSSPHCRNTPHKAGPPMFVPNPDGAPRSSVKLGTCATNSVTVA
ncbi:hypothetical protein NUW54_g378 [Trametes sanguinea]|uniref:Uncharacterized protein n=1 Tax=Trametes sanguinea TaxID=158606 RepID=A0ACC1QC37_9APHY|nr:hypothetical protein NUW54_g378 [Trametes sanguinea]